MKTSLEIIIIISLDINKLNNLLPNVLIPISNFIVLPNNHSLFETVLVVANDKLVDLLAQKEDWL